MCGAARAYVVCAMKYDDIKKIDYTCRQHFTYLADGVVDTWRTHLAEVEAGKGWQGDCDDLTSTTLDDLTRNGLLLVNAYRLLVSSTGGKVVDHMIGCVEDEDGKWWIVGDTFGECYSAGSCPHALIEYNRLSEHDANGAIWRSGAPFQ